MIHQLGLFKTKILTQIKETIFKHINIAKNQSII